MTGGERLHEIEEQRMAGRLNTRTQNLGAHWPDLITLFLALCLILGLIGIAIAR